MRRAASLIALLSLVVATQLTAGRAAVPLLAIAPPEPLPRSDGTCARRVGRTHPHERRIDNAAANRAMPPGPVQWSMQPQMARWRAWLAWRARVTGRYTGTTDQIFEWAACKWGLGADLLRAVALQESGWHQAMIGDDGESFGIMQIKDHDADGAPAWGGYPDTRADTALNVDFYAAYLRSCVDGDFYDGGTWLYGGRRVPDLIAERGADFVTWGCVGSWYSGHWYDAGARTYIRRVQSRFAARAWEAPAG